MTDYAFIALGALVLALSGFTGRFEGMSSENTRWGMAAWAAGLALPFLVGNPLLALGLLLCWASPGLSLLTTQSVGGKVHGTRIKIPGGFIDVASAMSKEQVIPALYTMAAAIGVLIGLREAFLRGLEWPIRWLFIAGALLNIFHGCVTTFTGWFKTSKMFPRTGYRGPCAWTGNPVHFGAIMALSLPMLFSAPVVLAVAVMAILVWASVLSASRVAVVTSGVAIGAWLFLQGLPLAALLSVPPMAMGIVIGHRWHWDPAAFSLIALRDFFASGGRVRLWRYASTWIKKHPIVGIGLGAWDVIVGRTFEPESPERWDNAHNEFLHVAVECGLPAALCFVAWFVLALSGAASVETTTGLAIAGIISLVQFPLRIPSVSPYVLYFVARSLAHI